MSVKAYAGLLLLVSVFCAVTGYQNDWDSNLYVDCYPQQALYRVRSYHDNGREDRRWQFYCRHTVNTRYSHCYWTGYENGWDAPLFFMCGVNYVMTGVSSYHDNGREDRRWRFKCCRAPGYTTKNCGMTGYINNWDSYMDYNSANHGKVFTGALSFHDNGREDRLWRMLECAYTK